MQRILGFAMAVLAGAAAFPALAARPADYKAPYNSLGQPDLDGTWTNATLTPEVRSPLFGTRALYAPDEIKTLETGQAAKVAEGNAKSDLSKDLNESSNVGAYNRGWIDGGNLVMRVHGEPRDSLLTTPDGQVPVKKGQPPRAVPADAGSAEAGKKAVAEAVAFDQLAAQGGTDVQIKALKDGKFDNPESRSTGERCLLGFARLAGPPMFPNGWYNNNYQIVQSRDAVVIDVEMVHDARVVRLNEKHRTDGVRPYFGDAIGHYEGPTLVVETTNFPEVQAYNGSWRNLKVTERFTRVAKDRLLYQFTVDDPTMWEKPWGGEYEFSPTKGRVMEYACHEGNYAMESMLAGAREQEREDAEVAGKRPIAAK